MKNALNKHVSDIFKSLSISGTAFETYEHNVDDIPEWANAVDITHEYMIWCKSDLKDMQKLSNFIEKDIYIYEQIYYRFEGDRLDVASDGAEKCIVIRPKHDTPEIDTKGGNDDDRCVTLPNWLDALIYGEMAAKYAPSGLAKEFDLNLHLRKEDILTYLGTYFPRSFAETAYIFSNLFMNPIIKKEFEEKIALDIFTVGSGTGGDILGLLSVINSKLPKIKEVYITAIDGNVEAQSIAKSIINRSKTHFDYRIDFRSENYTISNFAEYKNETCILAKPSSFDFVLSSKMINELISSGGEKCRDSYFEFAKQFLPLLKQNGLCLILDITTKMISNDMYIPKMISEQVNRAIRDMDDFQILLPLPCNIFGGKCKMRCFTQKTFYVSHSKKYQDKSKVSYRIIGRKNFVKKIGGASDKDVYSIMDESDTICVYSAGISGDKAEDGFSLE
jgi:hypothetical protein